MFRKRDSSGAFNNPVSISDFSGVTNFENMFKNQPLDNCNKRAIYDNLAAASVPSTTDGWLATSSPYAGWASLQCAAGRLLLGDSTADEAVPEDGAERLDLGLEDTKAYSE